LALPCHQPPDERATENLRRLEELTASISGMDSPRSGFHRATATSWALVGLGIAGVAATSTLAYADTVKPPSSEAPGVVGPVPQAPIPPPVVATPVPPVVDPPGPPTATTTSVDQPPQDTVGPPTEYPPRYTPDGTYQPAPFPREAKAPVTPSTAKRRNLTPTTVMAPNFSPHVTVSHGS
jgi:hypothetical protein